MKLLVISKIFPNKMEPTLGPFVLNETVELARSHEVRVVAPVPWFPPVKTLSQKRYYFSQIPLHETIQGLSVVHPRYFIVPKVGRSLYGFSYIQGIKKTIARIWSEFPFDAIITHYAYPYGYAATYFQLRYQRPLLLKVHGSDINIDAQHLSRRMGTMTALRRATRIIAVSKALSRRVQEMGISPDKVRVIYNGIDQSVFRVLDKAECRKKLHLNPNRLYFLFVGNLVPVKGIPILIHAFEQFLKESGQEITLLMLGRGELQSELENLIRQKKLTEHIKMLGPQPHALIPIWMNACDLLCLSSLNEGYPTVLIEAQSCGLPIVATDVGGVTEIIRNTGLERVVPSGNANAFATALSDILPEIKANSLNRQQRYQRTWKDVVWEMEQDLYEMVSKTKLK